MNTILRAKPGTMVLTLACVVSVFFTIGPAASNGTPATSNDVPYAESFETYSVNDSVITLANGWDASTNTYATITNGVPKDFTPPFWTNNYTGQYPMNGTTHTNVLRLDTEVGAVTNFFQGTEVYSLYSNIWIDAMVQFRVWSDDNFPAVAGDTGIQAAFFVDTNKHLVVYHAIRSITNTYSNAFTVLTDTTIDSNEWHRLTVNMDYGSAPGTPQRKGFQIRLDGGPAITNIFAFTNCFVSAYGTNGSCFLLANMGLGYAGRTNFHAISYSGIGYIDDLVVTNGPVAFSTRWWISAFASPAGGGTVLPSGTFQVDDGITLTITNTPTTYWTNAYVNADGMIDTARTEHAFGTISGDHSYTAVFAAVQIGDASSLSNAPQWWLAANNLTNYGGSYTWAESVTNDSDNDGYPNWYEHLASTDPTNADSTFKITETYQLNGTTYVKWISAAIDSYLPPFGVKRATNLVEGFTGIVGTQARGVTNIWAETGTPPTNVPVFYRIVATNAP